MRCLIDTNILISAALFPDSVPAKAFFKAVTPPHDAVVCDYSLDEMRRVFNRKFPNKISDYERFVATMALSVNIVATPPEDEAAAQGDERKIRDQKDRSIYRAAVAAKVDAILTGDKDFLESGITRPQMITVADFMQTT
ncbi:putative toxin-antitoxin system toxin component, PIN family [Desulfovibrio sp. OttesenSCG-928-C14]|nr:putative toxin-antitoxin system toxin component, PIN family [Desulfovibrio sp. OttesenSCG-928-C14]